MKRLIPLSAVALVLLLWPSSAIAEDNERGALFQFGIGPGFPSYPSEIEAIMAFVDSAPGVDRLKISLDIGLGVAVSPNSFVMARIDGTGDRLDDGIDFVQVNLYLYSLGNSWPLAFAASMRL
jgi:hypothetical protein